LLLLLRLLLKACIFFFTIAPTILSDVNSGNGVLLVTASAPSTTMTGFDLDIYASSSCSSPQGITIEAQK